MSLTFGFYEDAGRTLPLASLAIKGGTATRICVGTDGTAQAQAASGSGITLTANAVLPGVPASAIHLATSLSALASASASIDLGQVVSGMQAVWLLVDQSALADGEYSNVSLVTNPIYES